MRRMAAAALGCLLLCATAFAFPPAPHHILYGTVRNQFGDPLNLYPSEVFLETPSGGQLRCNLVNGLSQGFNYQLEVPMDSGTTPDLYQPTALRTAHSFRLKVRIGQATYLPIEMAVTSPQIGRPAERTRLDLTLGVDSDGDGLPDAWEEALIALHGGTLSGIRPGDDTDGDGISNLDEYLAGTYAFDPSDGFKLAIVEMLPAASILEMLAIQGRTYSLHASSDLDQWTPVSFSLSTDAAGSALRSHYTSTAVRMLRLAVPVQEGSPHRYFKATVH